VQGVFPLRQD
jgi:hypothetical protein